MKIITFFLPQFHEIEENNEWWGKGFTEWTNVKKARPLFNDHYQPREPLNDNYYNLLEKKVKIEQIELAKKYGVYGFCYYHYWFKDGKKLLEQPCEQILADKDLDFPFCLSWANEPWSRRWDGLDNEVIMPQEYGAKNEWKDHFNYLLPFLKDSRYITHNNQPIFLIYKPELIPHINEMLDYWQKLASQNGIEKISFIYQNPKFHFIKDKDDSRFDFAIEFEPFYSQHLKELNESKYSKLNKLLLSLIKDREHFSSFIKLYINRQLDKQKHTKFRFTNTIKYNYNEVLEVSTSHIPLSDKNIPGAFPSWDNTPRRGKNATLYQGSDPIKFKIYLSKQIKRAKEVYRKDFIFINAWNEWAEGAYLEPDKKYGVEYLNAIKEALKENDL